MIVQGELGKSWVRTKNKYRKQMTIEKSVFVTKSLRCAGIWLNIELGSTTILVHECGKGFKQVCLRRQGTQGNRH